MLGRGQLRSWTPIITATVIIIGAFQEVVGISFHETGLDYRGENVRSKLKRSSQATIH